MKVRHVQETRLVIRLFVSKSPVNMYICLKMEQPSDHQIKVSIFWGIWKSESRSIPVFIVGKGSIRLIIPTRIGEIVRLWNKMECFRFGHFSRCYGLIAKEQLSIFMCFQERTYLTFISCPVFSRFLNMFRHRPQPLYQPQALWIWRG